MKLKRRELLAGVVAVSASAAPPPTAEQIDQARAAMRANREAIQKVKLPMAVEPAFQFKA